MGLTFGYARVSTQDQTLDLQKDALKAAGCVRIFTDTMGGAKAERPGLTAAFDQLRAGDTLVVWRLDRLGRTLKDLLERVARLERDGIAFQSLTEQIDTTTPTGTLIFHIFGSLAEFERALIRERTQAGLVAARAREERGTTQRTARERSQDRGGRTAAVSGAARPGRRPLQAAGGVAVDVLSARRWKAASLTAGVMGQGGGGQASFLGFWAKKPGISLRLFIHAKWREILSFKVP